MGQVVLNLPDGETLTLSRDDAHVLVGRLWVIASKPGASPMAVKLAEAATTSPVHGRVVDVTEREYGALRIVMIDPPAVRAGGEL